jgi:hypothetical protein
MDGKFVAGRGDAQQEGYDACQRVERLVLPWRA